VKLSYISTFSAALLSQFALHCAPMLAQTNEAIEVLEAKMALQASAARMTNLETEVAKSAEQIKTLTESLASANGEASQTREAYEKLRIQMEGLGMTMLDTSGKELQHRLLTALSDLRILEEQKRSLAEAVIGLSEASLAVAKSVGAEKEEATKNLSVSLTSAEKALAKLQVSEKPETSGDLQNAGVVSLKDDLGIVVLNVGSKHGVHPGMPFSIYRQDKPIARALVVDVRGSICGAVLQDLVSKDEPVKVGDAGKVESIKG
jgi:hypothetical protein